MSINLLFLAAGESVFDTHDGDYPFCLAEINGTMLLEQVVAQTGGLADAAHAFAMLEAEVERYHLDRVAELLAPGARVFRVPHRTQGAACTALMAASQLDEEAELLIVSVNELVKVDLAATIESFKNERLDAGTLTFDSVHPRYSYVRLDEEGLVVEATQRRPISRHATAGVFWFAETGDFVRAAKSSIRKNASVDDLFFVAPTLNELILEGARIGVRRMGQHEYAPLKTERQYEQRQNEPRPHERSAA